MKYPTIKIKDFSLTENGYVVDNKHYSIAEMIQHCKENKWIEFDLPLVGIDLNAEPFSTTTFYDFVFEMTRVKNANLQYPILLSPEGFIADGWHRVAKAILDGKTTIKAIRMESLPTPCKVVNEYDGKD